MKAVDSKCDRFTQNKIFGMSEQSTSIGQRMSTRRCIQILADHCFWTDDSSSLTSEIHNKSVCSSSTTDDQKGDCLSSSGNPLSNGTVTVLNINEPLINIISKEEGSNMQQSISDEDVLKSDNHSQIEDLISLSSSLGEPENDKLINQALELAQSLLDRTQQLSKHSKKFSIGFLKYRFEIEGKKRCKKLEETNETKDESLNHSTDAVGSFKNRITSSAINTHTLLSRSDFTALEILNAIYCNAPVGGSRFVKPTSTAFSYIPPNAKSRTQLKTKTSTITSLESEQQTHECDEEEILHQQQCELMDEYFHRSGDYIKAPFHRQGQIWPDQKYYEYYEYLCKGIKRALSHPGSFDLDCGAGSVHTPYNQQANGICRAMKSNLYYQYSPGPEIYSRKVFVGGLPIDIDEDELTATFNRFGPLVVDWPNKGYVFLIFDYEVSVRALVQIRPWRLADADYVVEASIPLYARRAVFVGGVPRPIKAVELAHIMDRLYGSVGCAGIDTDVEYKYPKGAGRIAFINQNSYMKAITDRYVQLSHGEVEKRVELKPYVLDDQPCDECGGERCGHRHAPFFCPQLSCLQYYCEKCWTTIHGCRAREDHKPLVKEA
ncbi:Cytoplasmic polyadenylation element-binding protein 2 [Dirofilaria immitis]|nr:Cytoplasmic polyadenylation element-binding protein 2 [Dirofilaria immitis]